MSTARLPKDTAPQPRLPSRHSGPVPDAGPPPAAPAARNTAQAFTRAHRVLIGVVAAGAVVIAGIGFAGSYAAVRELALKKGFGNFSYVFPIGIDAGICVLLALDLLLTWIRIPFPLLRQTAWLLTMATIAFNGAAAWPDPLGVGMHAVIPVLFVVSVEAARHAIGRMADITADKHMEGVRLTRWLLSPLPTFLLWRRMKLWELRSYEQVIKLEQERLVYQARLHARFGRAWRRKAPVESLMPLRLARYGVPLTQTTNAAPAAGLNRPPPAPTTDRSAASPQAQGPAIAAGADSEPLQHHRTAQTAPVDAAPPPRRASPAEPDGRLADAYHKWLSRFRTEPTVTQFAFFLRDEYDIPTAAGRPLPGEQLLPLLKVLQKDHAGTPEGDSRREDTGYAPAGELTQHKHRHEPLPTPAKQDDTYPTAATVAARMNEQDSNTRAGNRPLPANFADPVTASPQPGPRNIKPPTKTTGPRTEEANGATSKQTPSETIPPPPQPQPQPDSVPTAARTAQERQDPATDAAAGQQTPPQEPAADGALTTVDRYYLAWTQYQEQHSDEPTAGQLSTFLADKGITSPSGKPVSPSTLRRYYVPFRIYRTWARHRTRSDAPSAGAVAQDCSTRGITAQYKKPITPDTITKQTPDFERRWHTLNPHHTNPQQ